MRKAVTSFNFPVDSFVVVVRSIRSSFAVTVNSILKMIRRVSVFAALLIASTDAFVGLQQTRAGSALASSATTVEQERRAQKEALLGLLGSQSPSNPNEKGYLDPVLADPDTKEPVRILAPSGPVLGGDSSLKSVKVSLLSPSNEFQGRSDTFLNLLEPSVEEAATTESSDSNSKVANALNSLRVLVPPPIRSALTAAGLGGGEYVPMRDLFTSPAVSFAYERGWRQGFAQAGFPGPDVEFQMARDFFEPAVAMADSATVVDMSCATGLFTRRFAKINEYDRVLGCDYSESMLTEARRRIRGDNELSASKLKTRLDLVRCDVGRIPMQDDSVEALHAGAAMHCWPDLETATQEIYRVLKPGGRYFATTFLSSYFATLQAAEGGDAATNPTRSAFQYFGSVEQLRDLMEQAGFESNKIQIEVLGSACVVIRCEK